MIPTLQVVKIQSVQILAGSETARMNGSSINNSSDFGARGAGFSDSDDWDE